MSVNITDCAALPRQHRSIQMQYQVADHRQSRDKNRIAGGGHTHLSGLGCRCDGIDDMTAGIGFLNGGHAGRIDVGYDYIILWITGIYRAVFNLLRIGDHGRVESAA